MAKQTFDTRTRPQWATMVAIGFFALAFGALIAGLGMIFGAVALAAIGSGLALLGIAVGSFGGFGYFISFRAA